MNCPHPDVAFAILPPSQSMKRFFNCRVVLIVLLSVTTHSLSENAHGQDAFTGSQPTINIPSMGEEVPRLPFEDEAIVADDQQFATAATPLPAPQTAAPQAVSSCQPCESNVVTDASLFPEVKNVNFFGVDRNACGDRWAGMCECKSLSYGCNCGESKPLRRIATMQWWKSKFCGGSCHDCGHQCDQNCSPDCDQKCADQSCDQ